MTLYSDTANEDRPTRGNESVPRGPRVTLPKLLLGLVIAYLPVWLPSAMRLAGLPTPDIGAAVVIIWNWLAVALLALHVGVLERLGPESLRLTRPTERDLEWAGYLGGAGLAWSWLASMILPADLAARHDAGEGSLTALGPLVMLGLVVTASVTEEVLWRGYAIERLGAWITPIPAAILVTTVFALGHLGTFGLGWLLTLLPSAIIGVVLLLWRRNLWACIMAHFITNFPLFVVSLVS